MPRPMNGHLGYLRGRRSRPASHARGNLTESATVPPAISTLLARSRLAGGRGR